MRVLIDWDKGLHLRFPGDAAHGIYDEDELTEVPGDVAERWRAARDAWWKVTIEAEAFQAASRATGNVTQ